jgi:hypothetical protein
VHNLALGVNSSQAVVFRGADLDACVTMLAHSAVEMAQKEGLEKTQR